MSAVMRAERTTTHMHALAAIFSSETRATYARPTGGGVVIVGIVGVGVGTVFM